MSPIKALGSNIGQKIIVATTALGLVLFVIIHLAGNLLLYVGEDAYNAYAEALHANPGLLIVAEIGLVVLFVLHIALALRLARKNRQARGKSYAVQGSKQGRTPVTPSLLMPISGVVILGFILLHLADLRLGLRHNFSGMTPASGTFFVLQDPVSIGVYILGTLFLGHHLWHGFQSIFQSLGLRSKSYTPLIEKIGMLLAIVLALGFVSFPVWGLLSRLGVI